MKSAAPQYFDGKVRGRRASAFTLIEVLVSLFILTIIISIGALSLDKVLEEGKLQKQSTAFKLAARKAMRRSITENRSYSVFMRESFFSLSPSQVRNSADGQPVIVEPQEDGSHIPGVRHLLPEDMLLLIRRWREKEYRLPDKIGEEWVFQPSGFCEPLSVEIRHGESYVRMTFNPLTARVDEDELYIP